MVRTPTTHKGKRSRHTKPPPSLKKGMVGLDLDSSRGPLSICVCEGLGEPPPLPPQNHSITSRLLLWGITSVGEAGFARVC